jgi:hypothetical protein
LSVVVVGGVVIAIVIRTDPAIVLKLWPMLVRAKRANSFGLESVQGAKETMGRGRLTGGAETRLGRERLFNSKKTEGKSTRVVDWGGDMNPSLI